ncbi:ABC transporter ATP-binding protein/permease [Longicatena caecimuris]|uniref:ABC transporter ATP-binding protein n=1 Tax=Longicatena caecimuris TaxID=1796635 RepID=UPI001D007FD4|nr:ABC transporter ATP-binding protein [Longicatena caecimuris]MCB5393382.1 ABC transporter ATP-binding protein/permease [Longicatena caecimuris]MCB5564283.1 ABC transporter ATP-binding protein/permease [Longicatena caecimuris]
MEKTQNKKSGIPRLLELAGEKKSLLVWGCILSTLSVFFQIIPFWAVYNIMAELLQNAADFSKADTSFMLSWAVKGILGLLLAYAFMYFGGMLGHTAAYRTLYGIRVRLSNHISELPLGWFNRNAIGKVKQIAEQDVEQIEKFIAHQLPDMVNTIVLLLVMVVIMFGLNPWLALACIIPIIIGFIAQFSMMFGKKAQEGLSEYYDALENISTSSVQYVRGMPSIKIFGQTVHSFRKFYQDIMSYRDFSTKYADNYEPTYCLFRVLVLSLATFIFAIGIFLFSGDPQNMAFAITLLFFLIFAPGISTPVFKFNSFGSSMNNITEGVRRIDEIMSEIPIQEPTDGKKPQGYEITFEHVSFSYEGKDSALVLKDVSFRAEQGQITAFVGPSGSGKSTIAQLIPRFWDVGTGQIKIGGVDIRDMKTEDLMASMSFVFQDSFLFSDTLYNNIAIGKPGATKEEVYTAAKAAQCHEFIEKLPQGYDTLIGEGGVYLSGGEEQRVSVARAILKNAPILILDEATAYADPENEFQMQLALQELIKNKTVLIIAHRLITIKNANKILVIKNGQIENAGAHEFLLQNSETYSAMWKAYTVSSDWQITAKKEVTHL